MLAIINITIAIRPTAWGEESLAAKRYKLPLNDSENNKQDELYRLIYYSKSASHVSGNAFAHHQEHLTVFTVSGSVHPSCCRLVSRMS
jgi:hypothetical protein